MDKSVDISIGKFIKLSKERFPDLNRAYLFGSHARGSATDESDIDLALIFGQIDDSLRFEVQVQLMLIAAKIDSRIEPHPLSFDDFNSGNPFAIEIKKTGLEIAGF